VCLVLLIFFILTTSYAALQKMLETPNVTGEGSQGVGDGRAEKEDVEKLMIHIQLKQEGGQTSFGSRSRKWIAIGFSRRSCDGLCRRARRRELLLEPDFDTPHWGCRGRARRRQGGAWHQSGSHPGPRRKSWESNRPQNTSPKLPARDTALPCWRCGLVFDTVSVVC